VVGRSCWLVLGKHPCFQPGHRGLPDEEVASMTAGAKGECTRVLLRFRWLHKVSPRRPSWDPCMSQLAQEFGAALVVEL